jgi:hypothetical protein
MTLGSPLTRNDLVEVP